MIPPTADRFSATLPRDLTAGLVVFLVALPLCLGVALAANAPPLAGLIAGIIGGVLVGFLSGSHTAVSGPALGLTAVVAAQLAALGSFEAFLLAVVLAGVLQIVLGLVRAGSIGAFLPTSVIKGLLAAIGIILILKQIPHVLGHDKDPEGDMAFFQLGDGNTFTELLGLLDYFELGATLIGVLSIALLVLWDKTPALKKSLVPAPLVVALLGVGLAMLFRRWGEPWSIDATHLVNVKVANSFAELRDFLSTPDWSQWRKPAIYTAAGTIAIVASLETLLNLQVVDNLDPKQRTTPPNRELIAQGVGNLTAGLIGGLPITAVVVRGSVNINAGARTKLSTIVHGLLLLGCVALLPTYLNSIPLSCLGAILLVTGLKLASPALFKQMWAEGRAQFVPFVVTVVAIVLTDLLIGILIGLAVSLGFILRSNMRRPLRRIVEKHLGGEVVRIELANQVSFLNRAVLGRTLDEIPPGGHVLLDAYHTNYIDPDVLDLIRDYKEVKAPARSVEVSLRGFRNKYQLDDQVQYVDYSTRELQSALTPAQVLDILKDGHERFRSGKRLWRDLSRQVQATGAGQHPLAAVLSCIDSRSPAELIFDLGVGDIFSVRIAGNIARRNVMGSLEYSTNVAGAKLILILGHTRCGAVTAAVNLKCTGQDPADATGCQHLDDIMHDIQLAIDPATCRGVLELSPAEQEAYVTEVARRNVRRVAELVVRESSTLRKLVDNGRIAVVGALYDVTTGEIEFL